MLLLWTHVVSTPSSMLHSSDPGPSVWRWDRTIPGSSSCWCWLCFITVMHKVSTCCSGPSQCSATEIIIITQSVKVFQSLFCFVCFLEGMAKSWEYFVLSLVMYIYMCIYICVYIYVCVCVYIYIYKHEGEKSTQIFFMFPFLHMISCLLRIRKRCNVSLKSVYIYIYSTKMNKLVCSW